MSRRLFLFKHQRAANRVSVRGQWGAWGRSAEPAAHLDVGGHPLMKLYGRLILERKVQVPHQQHHQANGQRHAQKQTHTLRSSPSRTQGSAEIHFILCAAQLRHMLSSSTMRSREAPEAAKQHATLDGSLQLRLLRIACAYPGQHT